MASHGWPESWAIGLPRPKPLVNHGQPWLAIDFFQMNVCPNELFPNRPSTVETIGHDAWRTAKTKLLRLWRFLRLQRLRKRRLCSATCTWRSIWRWWLPRDCWQGNWCLRTGSIANIGACGRCKARRSKLMVAMLRSWVQPCEPRQRR